MRWIGSCIGRARRSAFQLVVPLSPACAICGAELATLGEYNEHVCQHFASEVGPEERSAATSQRSSQSSSSSSSSASS
eukprot:7464636-Heterocapsa_arctica.AAC.1